MGASIVTVTMAFGHSSGPGAIGPHAWVERAVRSIRAQTYPHWRLVIINDADPDGPPWPLIREHLADPRIVPYDLPENRGRFFADAVLLGATPDPLWALQDPDDFAEPDRFARMVPLAESGMALAPSCWHHRGDDAPPPSANYMCQVIGCRARVDAKNINERASYSGIRSHTGYGSGVIATDRIRQVGGFHPDIRVGWDTYIMNACKLVGPWAVDMRPLQHKTMRAGSLATDPATRVGSAIRNDAWVRRERLYRRLVALHKAGESTAGIVREDVDPALWQEVEHHADHLRARMA